MFESQLTSLPLLRRGKVRDIYAVDNEHLLIVATDRISAFDVIMPTPIPQKGVILTTVSNFWFRQTVEIIPNHLSDLHINDVVSDPDEQALLFGRAVVVKRLEALPIEAVVRGYLAGSGWKEYQQQGKVCGISLPAGLRQAEELPYPIFTPATKAEVGEHDENICFDEVVAKIGQTLAEQVQEVSLALYGYARAYAAARGIIIADTKFEFGVTPEGRLVLIDEILTPDSSRFWAVDAYAVGMSPPSFDKQFLRDYLETLTWNKQPPAPELPIEIVARTAEKYREAQARLLG